MVRLIVCALALLSLSAPASAADWWFVAAGGPGSERTVFFIDKESMYSERAGTANAWGLIIDEKPESGSTTVRSLERYNCSEKTVTLLSYTRFYINGAVKNSFTRESYQQKPNYVAPDSILAALFSFVCKGPGADDVRVTSPETFAEDYFKD